MSSINLVEEFNKIYERRSMQKIDTLFKQNRDKIIPFAQVGRHVYEIFKISYKKPEIMRSPQNIRFSQYIDEIANDFKLDMRNGSNNRRSEINTIIDSLVELHDGPRYIDNIIREYDMAQIMSLAHIEHKNNMPTSEDMVSIGENIWIVEQLRKCDEREYNSLADCIKKINEHCRDTYYLIISLARALE